MKKIIKRWWFWLIVIAIISIIVFAVYKIKEEQESNKTAGNIADGINEFINETKSAKSYSDDFKYNYETGKVEYNPKITLQKYNKIEEGMSEKEAISILGDYGNKLEGEDTYLLEWGKVSADGYKIQIIMDKKENKVISKSQVGLY